MFYGFIYFNVNMLDVRMKTRAFTKFIKIMARTQQAANLATCIK